MPEKLKFKIGDVVRIKYNSDKERSSIGFLMDTLGVIKQVNDGRSLPYKIYLEKLSKAWIFDEHEIESVSKYESDKYWLKVFADA